MRREPEIREAIVTLQRVSMGQRGDGLHEGSRNPIAAHLSQVIHRVRVAVSIDESRQEDLVFAVDVPGASGVGADDVSVDDDGAGGEDTATVEDADVVECDLARGCCDWVLASWVVRCDCVGWVEWS